MRFCVLLPNRGATWLRLSTHWNTGGVHLEAEGETLLNSHQNHIAEWGHHSMHDNGLLRSSIPILIAMKIPAKAAVDKEWDKLNNLPAWKVLGKADVMHEAQNKKTHVHLSTLTDICHLGNTQSLQGRCKITRLSRASRKQCQKWRRMPSSLYWTRSNRIADDSSRSSGHSFPSTWKGWRSNWRSLGLHTSQHGGCSWIA